MKTTVMHPTKTVIEKRWVELQSKIQGTVITPNDAQYDQTRQAWNLSYAHRPAAIVVVEGVMDVVEAVQFAARQKLSLTVQSTGHGTVRPADPNDLLISTAKMKRIRVDAAAQTAWVEAGVKWGEVLEQSQTVGLTPLLGSSSDVGVVGYTLGGGFGWLGRKYGLATDSVNFFELVTADGRLRRAGALENSDLFWALRGGGGSLGIVTGMEIKLYPVSTVYGGNLYYPVEMAKEVLARYRSWIASAPDELTSSVSLVNFPPMSDIPQPLRGQSFVIIRGCYSGPVEQGEALVQSWRQWLAPVIDDFKVMPFSQVDTISNEPLDPLPVLSTSAWLRELGDKVIDTLIRHTVPGNGPSPLLLAEIRHAGGAVARVSAQASAYGNREASLLLHMLAVTPTQEDYSHLAQYTAQIKAELQPYLTGGVYLNFLEGQESQQRVQAGFSPEAYQRLMSLKAAYDPNNLLRSGFNISA